MLSEHYKQVHYHPQKSTDLDAVSSALHCVCCFDHISWKDAFRKLIHNGAKIGTMPQDRRSIRAMLSEMGFFLQAGAYADERSVKKMIIEEFEERFQDGEEVIVNLVDTPTHGFYLSLVPVKLDGKFYYELQYPVNYLNYRVREVWIRWKDCQDHNIMPRHKNGSKTRSREMPAQDGETLFARNENPTDLLVGDCAVRALAGVLEIPWEEAALKLAEAGDYVHMPINSYYNIGKCLEEGYEWHEPIKKGQRCLTGKEFCTIIQDMFPAGTRIYACSKRSHVVAILVFDGNYKIVDTWDSTNRPIVGYWAKYPKRGKRPKRQVQQDNTLTELKPNMQIRHKVYGVGVVKSITNGIALIVFADGVEKQLAEKWVLANCKKVVAEGE